MENITLHVLSCGDCSVCCDVVGVQEIGKPYQTRCISQTDNGCACYKTRPWSCQVFYCLWAAGAFGDNDLYKPTKSGWLVTVENPEEVGGLTLDVFQLKPETQESDYDLLRDMIQTIPKSARDHVLAIRYFGYKHVMGSTFQAQPPYKANSDHTKKNPFACTVGSLLQVHLPTQDTEGTMQSLYAEFGAYISKIEHAMRNVSLD